MKSTLITLISLLITLTMILSSCYYDNEVELYPGSLNCDVTNVDFTLTIKPIISTQCATSGCHVSGTGRKDLSTDQGIMNIAHDGRMEEYVLIRKDMPPSQPLSTCEQAYIMEWLKNGSPAN